MNLEQRSEQVRKDFALVASTFEGRRVLGHIISACRMFERNFDAASETNTAFLEGMRYVGIQISEALDTRDLFECIDAARRFDERFSEEGDYGRDEGSGDDAR